MANFLSNVLYYFYKLIPTVNNPPVFFFSRVKSLSLFTVFLSKGFLACLTLSDEIFDKSKANNSTFNVQLKFELNQSFLKISNLSGNLKS